MGRDRGFVWFVQDTDEERVLNECQKRPNTGIEVQYGLFRIGMRSERGIG